MPLIKLPTFPAFIKFQYLYLPPALASPQTSCVHLVSISKIPPRCPSTTSCIHLASISKLPPRCPSATSWSHLISYLVPPCLSAFSCMHLLSKSRLPPLISPQLLACFVIWVQCLGFTRHLSATYCAHLVLISSFLFPQCAFQLPASIWFHM